MPTTKILYSFKYGGRCRYSVIDYSTYNYYIENSCIKNI